MEVVSSELMRQHHISWIKLRKFHLIEVEVHIVKNYVDSTENTGRNEYGLEINTVESHRLL